MIIVIKDENNGTSRGSRALGITLTRKKTNIEVHELKGV